MKALPLLLLLYASAVPAQSQTPDWVQEEMEVMIGRWIADNSAYQSEDEPYESYGIEWSWGIGEGSVVGRLFGLHDGEEVGPFWDFRQFWHPGEEQLMVYQFGWGGVVGVGPVERVDEHTSRLLQTFYDPDGSTRRVGHRTERRDGVERGQSFDVSEDGTWTERRTYTWHKVD